MFIYNEYICYGNKSKYIDSTLDSGAATRGSVCTTPLETEILFNCLNDTSIESLHMRHGYRKKLTVCQNN